MPIAVLLAEVGREVVDAFPSVDAMTGIAYRLYVQ